MYNHSYCAYYTYPYTHVRKQNVWKDTRHIKSSTMTISGKWNSIANKMGNNRELLHF